MEPDNGGKSSFEIVSEFLEQLGDRPPGVEEVRRIRPALDDLVAKITRLHQMSPAFAGVTLSPEVLRLVRIAHDTGSGRWKVAAML